MSSWQRILFILLTAGLLLGPAGCAGPYRPPCRDPQSIAFTAPVDSLGLAAFKQLPADEQQERRRRAERLLDDAADQPTPDARIQALIDAAGLTPDDPEPWLQLAEIWRWLGLYLRSVECLDQASEAIRELSGADWEFERGRRFARRCVLRTMLIRAWLHYDRAEWNEGLNWAEGAFHLEPGDAETMQITGLLKGMAGYWSHAQEIARDIYRSDPESLDSRWIRAMSEVGRGRFDEARIRGPRAGTPHAAEAWRDAGRLHERRREWSDALFNYRHSAAALPFTDRSCVSMIEVRVLDPKAPQRALPVWLAYGRYYLTGSLSAYARLSLDNFQRYPAGPDRDFWSAAVVNATGILVRHDLDKPWALRARGLVFAATGMPDLGLADLDRASQLLGEADQADAAMESALGHMLLMKEDHLAALPHLRRAVELDPADALAWSDLGLALIMTGETADANLALSRAIELDPGLATAWYNRGLMHLHAEELDAAEADLREAARLAPGNPDMGQLLQQIRRLREKQAESSP